MKSLFTRADTNFTSRLDFDSMSIIWIKRAGFVIQDFRSNKSHSLLWLNGWGSATLFCSFTKNRQESILGIGIMRITGVCYKYNKNENRLNCIFLPSPIVYCCSCISHMTLHSKNSAFKFKCIQPLQIEFSTNWPLHLHWCIQQRDRDGKHLYQFHHAFPVNQIHKVGIANTILYCSITVLTITRFIDVKCIF